MYQLYNLNPSLPTNRIACSYSFISPPDLMALFKDSYTPSPVPVLLEIMFDVREWLTPVNPQLHNISNPHIFFLTKNANGSVVLRYKQWSRDNEWLPSKDPSKCIEIIKQVCKNFTSIDQYSYLAPVA